LEERVNWSQDHAQAARATIRLVFSLDTLNAFWLFCAACAMVMAIILLVLLRPLKKAMPGV